MVSTCCSFQVAVLNHEGHTWVLLILLFGKYLENCQVLSGEHIRSSHFFLPRESSTGLEEKSSSQISLWGGPVLTSSAPKRASSDKLTASENLLVSAAAQTARNAFVWFLLPHVFSNWQILVWSLCETCLRQPVLLNLVQVVKSVRLK